MEIKARWVSLGDLMDCLRERKKWKMCFLILPWQHTTHNGHLLFLNKKDFRFLLISQMAGTRQQLLGGCHFNVYAHTHIAGFIGLYRV